jgi:hypothetical protein
MRAGNAALAVLACFAAAAAQAGDSLLPAAKLHDSFNYFLLEGLKAARAEWEPDACLAAAFVAFFPEVKGVAGTQPRAAGEEYEFYFYSPMKTTNSFRYRSPFQASGPGEIAADEVDVLKGGAPVGNPPACITALPVTVTQAYLGALGAGAVLGEDTVYIALDDFSTYQTHTLTRVPSYFQLQPSLGKLHRLVWAVATRHGDRLTTLHVIDAERGGRIKAAIVQWDRSESPGGSARGR